MAVEKRKEYLVTAVSKRPLASFEDAGAADSFRAERAKRRVRTRLFEVQTVRKELP